MTVTKLQIAAAVAVALVGATGILVRVKRISPVGWGWYGQTETSGGLAAHGYDVVAYRSAGAVQGLADYTSSWHGATWRFSGAANKAAFDANPESFAPAFDGYCSYAASKGFTAKVDPTAFRVEGDKLYLFNDASMRDKWVSELGDSVIARGVANWRSRPAP